MIRLALVVALLAVARPAWAGDEALCQRAVDAASRRHALPRDLLTAMSLVEAGRPAGGRLLAWPWTINVAGAGQFFPSKAGAIEAVRALQAVGQASIDVGCMQVNLAEHPQAFTSLEDAFDPARNADYAARFLLDLQSRFGLPAAVTAYHSQTPDRAAAYARQIVAIWPAGAKLGLADGGPRLPPDPSVLDVLKSDRISFRSERGRAWPRPAS